MTTVDVFDPPMCCATGVCGPSADPALVTFAADLKWLGDQGVTVQRHNLSQEPGAFVERDLIRGLLDENGDAALPAVVVDGALRTSGRYPSREEMAAWARGARGRGGLDAVSAELVAIGAAIGANCEPCLTHHYREARRLGLEPAILAAAVRVAQTVKDVPARSLRDLAARLLDGTEPGSDRASVAVAAPAGSVADAPAAGAGDQEASARHGQPGVAVSGCCGGAAATEASSASTVACCEAG